MGEFHYVHHDCDGTPYQNVGEMAERICGAAQISGINLTLLPSFYAHSNFGGADPTTRGSDGSSRHRISSRRLARSRGPEAVHGRPAGRQSWGVAPHSLRAVTLDELRAIVPLGRGRPLHIHVAEQMREVEDCVASTGLRPVEWLLENAPVDPSWCLIHATHLTPGEIESVARSGATVGLCPITEANLGDGVFPAASFLACGGRFGIGTDSNVDIHAAGELRALEYSQRLTRRARNVLADGSGASCGRSLFDHALAGGNRALGRPAGGLEIGGPADVVALACDYPSLARRERGDTVLDRYIFGGRSGYAVDSVWVRGRRVVADGRHLRRDEIQARCRRTLHRVLTSDA